jgi:hypothetical protein
MPDTDVQPFLVDPVTGMRAFFVQPHGYLVELPASYPNVDDKVAAFMIDRVYPATKARGEPVLHLGDWTAMKSYTSSSRRVLTDWIIRERRVLRAVAVAIPRQNSVVEMGIMVARVGLRVAGIDLAIEHTRDAMLARHQARVVSA